MPSSDSRTTANGNTYFPNTFQVPNIAVDRLARHLPPAAFDLYIVACRKILGYELHRQTLRDRISRSQFHQLTGFAMNTISTATDILARAKLLIPIGSPTADGQEYELNLGQQGDYDWAYLERLSARAGNPDPAAARQAANARRLQPSLDLPEGGPNQTPYMGGNPPQNLNPLPVVQGDLVSPIAIQGTSYTLASLWDVVLMELQVGVSAMAFTAFIKPLAPIAYDPAARTLTLASSEPEHLRLRYTFSIRRILKALTHLEIEPIFTAVPEPVKS